MADLYCPMEIYCEDEDDDDPLFRIQEEIHSRKHIVTLLLKYSQIRRLWISSLSIWGSPRADFSSTTTDWTIIVITGSRHCKLFGFNWFCYLCLIITCPFVGHKLQGRAVLIINNLVHHHRSCEKKELVNCAITLREHGQVQVDKLIRSRNQSNGDWRQTGRWLSLLSLWTDKWNANEGFILSTVNSFKWPINNEKQTRNGMETLTNLKDSSSCWNMELSAALFISEWVEEKMDLQIHCW